VNVINIKLSQLEKWSSLILLGLVYLWD